MTATLIRFLADLEVEQVRDEFRDFDLPPQLPELDPTRWTLEDVQRRKYDLQSVAVPGTGTSGRRFPRAGDHVGCMSTLSCSLRCSFRKLTDESAHALGDDRSTLDGIVPETG